MGSSAVIPSSRFLLLVLVLTFTALLIDASVYDLGAFTVSVTGTTNPSIVVTYEDTKKVIWETASGSESSSSSAPLPLPFLQYGTADVLQQPILNGNYQVKEDVTVQSAYVTVKNSNLDGNRLTLSGLFLDSSNNAINNCGYSMSFQQIEASSGEGSSYPSVQFNVTTTGNCFTSEETQSYSDRLFLQYSSFQDENFYGFGESFSYFNLKGRNVSIIVSEQGLGRGEEPITSFENSKMPGVGGYWYTTYAPKAIYVTNYNRSVFIDIPETMFVDLTAPTVVRVECWANSVNGKIYYGESWLDLIEAITSDTGRQKQLPAWSQKGAVVGLEGGTANVTRIVNSLVENKVPVKGVWLQDWVGLRHSPIDGDRLIWNWEVNFDWYPGWQEMVSAWALEGIRVLTYISPFFSDPTNFTTTVRQNFYQEGIEKGYFVKHENGEPYRMNSLTIEFCMIDPTNPDAVKWMIDIIKNYTIIEANSSGWMCDFGEYMPFDGVLFDGTKASSYHNMYPQAWSEIAMKAITDMEKEDEILFFSRSAWTRSPKSVPIFWLGDQLISWDANDGIKTVITGALSSGITGHALTHSDIGGYNVVFNLGPTMYYVRTPELLKRWSELAAFGSALYRTHIGSSTTLLDAQCYDTDDSMAHFGEFAEIFGNLSSYRALLIEQAASKGYPLIRPLALHYFWDPNIWSESFNNGDVQLQYMFGEDFIIAPSLNEGQTETNIYLPSNSGSWVHIWSGHVIETGSSGTWVNNVQAGIGFPCVFYRSGSVYGKQLFEFITSKGYTDGYTWGVEGASDDKEYPDGWTSLSVGEQAGIIIAIAITVVAVIYFAKKSFSQKRSSTTDYKSESLTRSSDITYSLIQRGDDDVNVN